MKEFKEPQVRPFCNGTEAEIWLSDNCNRCVKAYHPKGEWPKDETVRKYIGCGKECKMKYFIDIGFITSKIPISIAQQIGVNYIEKGYCSLKESCMMFSDNEDDGYRPPKRPRPRPDNTPGNQLVMPFFVDDILRDYERKQLEEV